MTWGRMAASTLSFSDMTACLTPQSLPLVNILTSTLSGDFYTNGHITIAQYGKQPLNHSCLVRLRGKTALYLPKKSFAIKLVDEQGENLDDNLLGLRTDNTWILDAMGIDKLRMRNRVLFDIWNEFSHTMWNTNYNNRNGTVGTMVEVFINGDYNGIYCLSDKVNRKLLNLRKAKQNDDGTITVKGLLYKGTNNKLSSKLIEYEQEPTDSVVWNSFELQHPDDYPSLQAWQPLINLIEFNGNSTDEFFRENYRQWYYVDNLVDYWIMLMAFGVTDMPYKNTFLSTPDVNFDHRFMLTPWDMDAALGREYDGSLANYNVDHKRLNEFAPYNRLITQNIDGFKDKVARRWTQLVQHELSPSNLESHIRTFAQQFVESGAWQREIDRWQNQGIDVTADIESEITYVMRWYRSNINHLSAQLQPWLDTPYDPSTITSHTVISIYNYILGIDSEYDNNLDIDNDGKITAADVTAAYNALLSVDPGTIDSNTIIRIYNYILGIDTTFDNYLDIDHDGKITAADVTAAYDIILSTHASVSLTNSGAQPPIFNKLILR